MKLRTDICRTPFEDQNRTRRLNVGYCLRQNVIGMLVIANSTSISSLYRADVFFACTNLERDYKTWVTGFIQKYEAQCICRNLVFFG